MRNRYLLSGEEEYRRARDEVREQEKIRKQKKKEDANRDVVLNNNHLFSFKEGNYEYSNKNFKYGNYKISVLKKTKKMLHLHIIYYNGYLYDLDDVKIKRKIYIDEYGAEYLDTIYFNWNTPQKQSWRCDSFKIEAKDLNSNEVKLFS